MLSCHNGLLPLWNQKLKQTFPSNKLPLSRCFITAREKERTQRLGGFISSNNRFLPKQLRPMEVKQRHPRLVRNQHLTSRNCLLLKLTQTKMPTKPLLETYSGMIQIWPLICAKLWPLTLPPYKAFLLAACHQGSEPQAVWSVCS